MRIPDEQRSPHGPNNPSSDEQTIPHQRQGDRGSGDDPPPRLPVFVKFKDLQVSGIVTSWQQLGNLMDEQGFPIGLMIGKNSRVWDIAEVRAWLASRPTARKGPPPAKKPRGRPKKVTETN